MILFPGIGAWDADGDSHYSGIAQAAVGDGVSEGVNAVELGVRSIDDTRPFKADAAIRRITDADDRQRIILRVGVVVQNGDSDRGVFEGGGDVIYSIRSLVRHVHADGHGGCVDQASSVADRVGEDVGAGEAKVGSIS